MLGPFDNSALCTYSVHMIKFEWDEAKASSNLKKHGISFHEAKSVFYDENAVQFYDDTNSILSEDRFLMLGMSSHSNVLTVCHCEREDGSKIRIISARKATKKELNYYGGK